jgi:hypothetical protein
VLKGKESMTNYILTISNNDKENMKDFTIFQLDNGVEKVVNYGSYYLTNENYIIEELKANYENLQIER